MSTKVVGYIRVSTKEQAVLDHKRASGQYAGGKVPWGFKVNKESHALEECETEQRITLIAKAFREHYPEWSLRDIALGLDTQGYVSRNQKPFSAEMVKRILAS